MNCGRRELFHYLFNLTTITCFSSVFFHIWKSSTLEACRLSSILTSLNLEKHLVFFKVNPMTHSCQLCFDSFAAPKLASKAVIFTFLLSKQSLHENLLFQTWLCRSNHMSLLVLLLSLLNLYCYPLPVPEGLFG